MRQGANLSAWDALSFRVRGSGATHRLMVFAEALGRRPATKTFRATGEWTRHVFPLEAFRGIDGSGLVGVLFTSEGTGRFEYRIDDVRFVRQERGSSDGGS